MNQLFTTLLCCLPTIVLQAQLFNVFPGDTNNDSIANVRDILPVGIAFDSPTTPREDMTINWEPKLVFDEFGLFLPNTLVNFVHIDANGDGFINDLDIDAIALNYDSTASDDLPPAWQPEVFAPVSYCPSLHIVFDRDTIAEKDTFLVEVQLNFSPDVMVPEPDGILGLSFALNFDPSLVKDNLIEIIPVINPDNLMFVTASSQSSDFFRVPPPGRVEIGAAARGTNAIRVSRPIVQFIVIVEDMIFRSNESVPFWIDLDPESLLIVNRREEVIKSCFTPSDTIFIIDDVNAIDEIAQNQNFQAFPNPTKNEMTISLPFAGKEAVLFNVFGQTIWRKPLPSSRNLQLQWPDFPNGTYFLAIKTERGILRKKVLISH